MARTLLQEKAKRKRLVAQKELDKVQHCMVNFYKEQNEALHDELGFYRECLAIEQNYVTQIRKRLRRYERRHQNVARRLHTLRHRVAMTIFDMPDLQILFEDVLEEDAATTDDEQSQSSDSDTDIEVQRIEHGLIA